MCVARNHAHFVGAVRETHGIGHILLIDELELLDLGPLPAILLCIASSCVHMRFKG
jgi:hypothetical protein